MAKMGMPGIRRMSSWPRPLLWMALGLPLVGIMVILSAESLPERRLHKGWT